MGRSQHRFGSPRLNYCPIMEARILLRVSLIMNFNRSALSLAVFFIAGLALSQARPEGASLLIGSKDGSLAAAAKLATGMRFV